MHGLGSVMIFEKKKSYSLWKLNQNVSHKSNLTTNPDQEGNESF